jgi:hypothetical protein|tara:strand:+ start:616 stop:846 length:231 start_codon:yes stop_codon:yes gene_type:complete
MINSTYFLSEDLELSCCLDHDDETKIVFIIFNHELASETVISEETAKYLCITSDSTINLNNWIDFKNGTRMFQKDN